MKHYKNLMSALGDAMPVCLAWRLAGTEDNYFNARDVFAFALSDDKAEGSLKEGQFYLVSAEGAIGIASGYEYFVRWLFIPLEGERYDLEVMRLKQELANDAKPQPAPQPQPQAQPQQAWQQPQARPQVQQQSEQQQAWQAQPQARPQVQPQAQAQQMRQPQAQPQQMRQPQAQQQPQGQPQPVQRRFCAQCGAPLNPNAKFCGSCGNPVLE